MAAGTAPHSSRSLHVLAWVTCCAVFPLIFMGGLVTSHRAGLAVPDWPNSYGYNMFLFPVSMWVGGIFFEHTHRLLGTVAGFCSILLMFQAYAPARNAGARYFIALGAIFGYVLAGVLLGTMLATGATDPMTSAAAGPLSQSFVGFLGLAVVLTAAYFPRVPEGRRWVRRLTVGIFCAVLFQGLLGGLRVVWVNLNLAVVHGCFAQAFFCLCALLVVVTSRWWESQELSNGGVGIERGSAMVRLALAAVVVVYLQLIAGALMRHFDAGLAIPDLPLAYGHVLPPTSDAELGAINAARAGDQFYSLWNAPGQNPLGPVTLWQIWLHFTHRVGAVVVTITLVTLIAYTLRRQTNKVLTRPAWMLGFLLLAQLTLGVLSVLSRKRAEIATAHVAVGALVLVTTFVLFVRSARLYGRGKKDIIATPLPDPAGARAVPA